MASKSQSSENLKQKSLMSFFGKSQQSTPSSSHSVKKPVTVKKTQSQVKDASKFASSEQTPGPKKPDLRALSSSAAASSSSYSSSIKDTPPTSDAIDLDMLSSEEAERSRPRVTAKRRRIIDDSDEEVQASGASSNSRPSSSLPPSSPSERRSRVKKARYSEVISDEDEDSEVTSSFTHRVTKFKKSPVRKSSKASEDDDDFIVPSEDSDIEVGSAKTSSSRSSSRQSYLSDEVENDDEPVSKNSKLKGKAIVKASASAQVSDSLSFLTAAERREQDKRDGKKAAESPYGFLQDVKDKDGKRPGDPKYDPRTLYIPPKAWKEFTPFEKQFWEIKQNHYDTILFFQKGKFFELYEDDARIGHQEFDLKLTQRVKMSMVGVPEMSFNFWAAKFLGKGYKVGKVEQSETALGAEMRLADDKKSGKQKGGEKEKIVRRELNKVYTNGTLIDGEMITDDEAGHCISVREVESDDGSHNTFGICVLDCSTSQFDLAVFEDDICRTKLETMIRQIRPKEMLFTKSNLSVSTTRLLKSILPAACLWTGLREVEGLGYDDTLEDLKTRFPATDEMSDETDHLLPESVPKPIRDMADSKPAIEALGSLIWYLHQLNIDKDIITMKNFNVYDPMKRGEGLVLDGQTLAHIEVLLNNEGTEDGSLLKLLGRCVTPFGKRLFRIWLCMPLRQIAAINARLDAVQDLMDHPTFENAFKEIAKGLPDLERVVSRIHARNCKVKDFLKVLMAFKKLSRGLEDLANASESFTSKTVLGLLRSAPVLIKNIKNIESMFEKPSSEKDDELVPRDGKDETYDEVMTEIEELEQMLDGALKKFEKTLGVKLNWWHSAVGSKEIYMVETAAGQKNIPKDWTKNSGTKAKTRWLVPSLQKSIRSLKEAREKRNTAIREFQFRLYAEFDEDRAVWLRAIRVFAELDCLFSLAKSSTAIGEPACRPEFVEDEAAWVDFKSLRHPTLCASTSVDDFIPNDIKLGGDVGKIALLTGPNMAGKSTVMRMTATGIIMAQLGMFVPAESARLSPVDSILTRMGAYDNMFSNASTFKVELDECCKILRDATPKSFVILDELGRGTSTYDGMAIAGAVLHELATHTLPLSFFATHYGSLTDDFAYHPNIRNMYMSTIVDDEKRAIVFLYKLIEGVATSSFGTHVANLAGVPIEVVERADVISKNFAEQFKAKLQEKQKKRPSGRLPLVAQADFAYLVQLSIGKVQLPEDQVRRKVVLSMMKKVVQTYIAPQS
ncbi:muts domain V-domain-containing protein [Lentinula aciculospora]|uniref:DNA mismatch repair protein n=1 Tax=Lentinula aciculospora TaxID=153920 RepID=A0A9W9AHI4_9AGAR|nr:muts domain V-domain-containing protein [Lentinula aciculospora]